jgi:hypothetical protein
MAPLDQDQPAANVGVLRELSALAAAAISLWAVLIFFAP